MNAPDNHCQYQAVVVYLLPLGIILSECHLWPLFGLSEATNLFGKLIGRQSTKPAYTALYSDSTLFFLKIVLVRRQTLAQSDLKQQSVGKNIETYSIVSKLY